MNAELDLVNSIYLIVTFRTGNFSIHVLAFNMPSLAH